MRCVLLYTHLPIPSGRPYMCDTTISYVKHDLLTCETWLRYVRDVSCSYVWRDVLDDSFMCVAWLIHMCDTAHSYLKHDLFTCEIWLSHVCDVTHSYVRDMTCRWGVCCCTHTFPFPSGRPYVWDMTHSYVWYDSLIAVTWLINEACVAVHLPSWLSHVCGVTHSYVRDMTCRWGMCCCTHTFSIPSGRPYVWDMTQSYVWHVCDMTHSPIQLGRPYVWDMTQLHVWQDSFIYVAWLVYYSQTFGELHICELGVFRSMFLTPLAEVTP